MVDPDFVIETWETIANASEQNIVGAKRVLNVMRAIAGGIPAAEAASVAHKLLVILQSYSASTDIIHSLILALHALCVAKAPDAKAAKAITTNWASTMFTASNEVLKDFVMNSKGTLYICIYNNVYIICKYVIF